MFEEAGLSLLFWTICLPLPIHNSRVSTDPGKAEVNYGSRTIPKGRSWKDALPARRKEDDMDDDLRKAFYAFAKGLQVCSFYSNSDFLITSYVLLITSYACLQTSILTLNMPVWLFTFLIWLDLDWSLPSGEFEHQGAESQPHPHDLWSCSRDHARAWRRFPARLWRSE